MKEYLFIIIPIVVIIWIGGFAIGVKQGNEMPIEISDDYFVIQKIEQTEKSQRIYSMKYGDKNFILKSANQYNIGDSLKIIKH